MADEPLSQSRDEGLGPAPIQAQPYAYGETQPYAYEEPQPFAYGEPQPYAPEAQRAYTPVPEGQQGFEPIDVPQSVSEEQLQATAETGRYDSVGQADPIRVQAITVRTGRLVCDVQIADARFRYTTPRLSAFASGQYPDLPHHACVNEVGNRFGYVMERTSVAHLLEHLVISEQVRDEKSGSATFAGTTEWTDEGAGLARVEVGFKDDLVALRAFKEATRFLNMAVLTCLA